MRVCQRLRIHLWELGILKRLIVSPAVYPRFLEIAELARSLCHSWATCSVNCITYWHYCCERRRHNCSSTSCCNWYSVSDGSEDGASVQSERYSAKTKVVFVLMKQLFWAQLSELFKMLSVACMCVSVTLSECMSKLTQIVTATCRYL